MSYLSQLEMSSPASEQLGRQRMALVTMDSDELNRLRIIQDLVSRRTTLLNISRRQVRRLRDRYLAQGARRWRTEASIAPVTDPSAGLTLGDLFDDLAPTQIAREEVRSRGLAFDADGAFKCERRASSRRSAPVVHHRATPRSPGPAPLIAVVELLLLSDCGKPMPLRHCSMWRHAFAARTASIRLR
jgi:hypothetical protein